MNFVFIIELSLFYYLLTYVNSDTCVGIQNTAKLCAEKVYEPTDMLHEPNYRSIDITFLKMEGRVNFTIPKELLVEKYENAIYKKFLIESSCVNDIQEDFFRNIDKGNKALEEITFKNVSCLRNLQTKSFRGIGDFVKILRFESMPDLLEIENDFFDSLIVLKNMTIINTAITILPQNIFMKMPNIGSLNIYNNQLSLLPQIPKERLDLIDKIFAYNNPFNCICVLKPFVESMKKTLSSETYKCFTPHHLKDQALIKVDLCELDLIRSIKTKEKEEVVSVAKIRIEIIIAASLIILAIVIIVIIVVLYKRHAKVKKPKLVYQQGSPSKIVFTNENEPSRPFVFQYQS